MSRRHVASLDGLRGLAVLAVVFHHYFPKKGTGLLGYVASSGWAGVDLFFVLSGFLITGILFDSLGSDGFYQNFYIRRALRLFPVYLIFVCIALLLAHGPGHHSWAMTLTYLIYASNIVRFFQPDFNAVGPTYTGHLWSLAVEEQFYLIWPWIIAALASRKRILKVCIYGSIAALALRLLLAHLPFPSKAFLYLELPTRADSLLIGAAVAMLVRDPKFMANLRLSSVRVIGVLATVGTVILALHIHSFFWGYSPINTWGFSLIPIASAACLLLAISPGTWTNRILSCSFLRFYGRYSYGLYLVHYAPRDYCNDVVWPAIANRVHEKALAGLIFVGLILAVATAVAVLSFHFIELPFLRLKARFESPRTEATQEAETLLA